MTDTTDPIDRTNRTDRRTETTDRTAGASDRRGGRPTTARPAFLDEDLEEAPLVPHVGGESADAQLSAIRRELTTMRRRMERLETELTEN